MKEIPEFQPPWTTQSLTKGELEWAFQFMQENHSGEVLAVGGDTLEALCPEITLRDPNTEAWQAFSRAHDYLTPCPKVVWEAAWLAAEASFQEKHKYQHVCCPNCDHEFEYEPDLI